MKVLLVEPDPELRRTMVASLSVWGYEVLAHEDISSATQIAEEPEITIIDFSDNYEFSKKIHDLGFSTHTVVLAIVSVQNATSIIEAGADDYLNKPFEEKEFEFRVRSVKRIFQLRQAATAKASVDTLTGMLNHEAVIEALDRELTRSQRNDSYVAVLMLDLDHFKKINDTFGHLFGDAVLKQAASRMMETLRTYDVLGRYGGEEFMVVLPGCNSSTVLRVAERIRNHLAQTMFRFGVHETWVTASIGVAVTRSGRIDSQLLIDLADQALYRAKANGRNRVESALGISEDVPESAFTRDAIAEQLQMEIAHRKKTEQALRDAEERFRLISKATSDAIWDWDLTTDQVWSSAGVQTLFGYAENAAESSRWSQRLHPEDADRVLRKIQCLIDSGGDFWSDEYRYRRANGTYAHVLDRGYVLYDNKGKAIRMLGAMIDMTERKRSEMVQSALYRISEASSTARDMPQLYGTIHSIVGELMYAANFYIALYDSQTDRITFPYWVDEVDPAPPDPQESGKGLTAYVIRKGKPLLSTAENWEELRQTGEVELVGAYSFDWLGVPLISEEETIGVVVVQSYSEEIRYTEKEKDLLTFVSQHIATALKRKKTEERLREIEQRFIAFTHQDKTT
jgi:two-component system cell cycle response regulator